MNLVGLLIQQAAHRPDQPAIVEPVPLQGRDAVSTITFGELVDRTARAASMLRRTGVAHEDRILLLAPMSIEFYVALLAIWRVGATAVIVDPGHGFRHLRQACKCVRPTGLIGVLRACLLRLLVPSLLRVRHMWVTDGPRLITRLAPSLRFDAFRHCEPDDQPAPIASTTPALLTFTSGSTGEPKAAIRTHGALLAQYRSMRKAISLEPGEVDLVTLPMFALANLAAGLTSVIANGNLRHVARIEVGPIVRQISAHNVTRCSASPAFFSRLVQHDSPLPTLTKLFTGGAPVFPSLLERLSSACPIARVASVYGSTEAEPISRLDANDIDHATRQRMRSGAGIAAGLPVPGIEVRIIVDRTPEPLSALTRAEFDSLSVETGQPGEIVVAGDHVLPGYLDGKGDKENKINVEGRIWHRTGDAGCLDSDGGLWLHGPTTAKIVDDRGTLYPLSVEAAVDGIQGVRRTALIAQHRKRVLVIETGRDMNAMERKATKKRLAERLVWAAIDQFVFTDTIPVDRRHNAKTDYPELRRRLRRLPDET